MQIRTVDGFVGQTLGSYRVERLLGQSRLNAVYLARDMPTQRIDALTFYRVPEHFSREAYNRFLERFLQEAASISLLKHRHILPIYAFGESSGSPYLVTPYMMNGSLASMRKSQGRFSHGQVLEVLEQIASGLEAAHKLGHIHGTLRPANIVLSNEKIMLVAGFGLLRMLRASGLVQGKTSHLLSISGTFLIAPEYMAPEMVQGQTIDVRADVYALGAILFELLCGKAPFSGADPMSIARQHITQPAPSLRSFCPEVPVALESVINQALERDPARRFPYISELVEAFAQVSVGATGHLKIVPGLNEQGMSANGYSTSHWQLTPPIVTGKLPVVKLDGLAPYEEGDRSGNWQLRPPIVTGKLPTIRFPVEPEEQLTRDTPREHQAATSAFVPRPVAPASPNGYGGQSIRPFDWWSMPGPVQEPSAQPREAAKSRATPQRPPGLGGRDMAMKPLAQSRLRQSRRVGRREIVSVLVVGGIVAAGVGVVLNLDVLTGNRGNVPRPPVGTSVSLPANSIGGSNMALNSALDFINPADKKPSLLIRMPDGHYVAYEKACTHENVYVHYDAGTHTLICPAHGAIFDPADGGKVLQGPAVTPLPQVKVHVLADGTVVAG